MQVGSLGQKDPLEKEMATHSSVLAWRSPWTRGAWQAIVQGAAKSRTQLRRLSTHTKILTLTLDLYIFCFYNMCFWGLKYYLQTLLHIF